MRCPGEGFGGVRERRAGGGWGESIYWERKGGVDARGGGGLEDNVGVGIGCFEVSEYLWLAPTLPIMELMERRNHK